MMLSFHANLTAAVFVNNGKITYKDINKDSLVIMSQTYQYNILWSQWEAMNITSRCSNRCNDASLWITITDRKEVVTCGLITNLHGEIDVFSSLWIVLTIGTWAVTFECWIHFIPTKHSCRLEIKWIKFLDLKVWHKYSYWRTWGYTYMISMVLSEKSTINTRDTSQNTSSTRFSIWLVGFGSRFQKLDEHSLITISLE